MNVIRTAVNILKSGQTPIITVDQLLYSFAKPLQWRLSETHGEVNF